MTDTWAAKVLADVPKMTSHGHPGASIEYDDALAALAKLGAGDGLVERLQQRDKSKHGYYGYVLYNRDGLEAAAHIAALTAQVAEKDEQLVSVLRREAATQQRHDAKMEAAEAERDDLRAKVARLEGALTDMPKAVLRTTVCQGPQWPDDRPGVWLAALEACAKSVQTAVNAAIPAADARAEALKEAAAVAAKFDSDGMYGAAAIHDAILALAPTPTTR